MPEGMQEPVPESAQEDVPEGMPSGTLAGPRDPAKDN
jgi:hypothetical protein